MKTLLNKLALHAMDILMIQMRFIMIFTSQTSVQAAKWQLIMINSFMLYVEVGTVLTNQIT